MISIPADQIDSANNEKLVHIMGDAISNQTLTDDLGVTKTDAIALFRKVEVYQWRESQKTTEKKNIGGSSTETTEYSYSIWV